MTHMREDVENREEAHPLPGNGYWWLLDDVKQEFPLQTPSMLLVQDAATPSPCLFVLMIAWSENRIKGKLVKQ